MDKVVTLDLQALNFESAVNEVDILIPNYLGALGFLEKADKFEEMSNCLHNVIVYWERLDFLFQQLAPLEEEVPFKEIMINSLQSELSILEKVYLKINFKIEFSKDNWDKALWEVVDSVLDRMDLVLEGLGFEDTHRDRILIKKMKLSNHKKFQEWHLRHSLEK